MAQLNEHEKFMKKLVLEETGNFIGGWENEMQDNPEGSDEYELAKQVLESGHEVLINEIYNQVMNSCKSTTYSSHARFAGKEFTIKQIDRLLVEWGY